MLNNQSLACAYRKIIKKKVQIVDRNLVRKEEHLIRNKIKL